MNVKSQKLKECSIYDTLPTVPKAGFFFGRIELEDEDLEQNV